MPIVWVKEFVGGLDTRRMPVTSPASVLIKAENGHITRGGEFEKRAAFVTAYELPAGTVGLAETRDGLYVFGSGDAPADMPPGVRYQKLPHMDGVTPLVRVPSWDLYGGKLYVVAEYADGSIQHFYNGQRVQDWDDGRARASFDVVDGGSQPAVSASGSFVITGGTAGSGNEITDITVDGISIIGAPVPHTGDNATTAADVADAINAYVSSPNYTAQATGDLVTITAVTPGAGSNGLVLSVSVGGDVTVGSVQDMAGGSDASVSTLDDIKVDGVSIIAAPVQWTTSNEATATAIATAINSYTSNPDYEATAVGTRVNIIAVDAGTTPNGRAVTFTLSNGFDVNPSTDLALAGGRNTSGSQATAELTITGGASGSQLTDLRVNGVSIIGTPVAWTTSNANTAALVRNAINAYTSNPNYTATSSGATVTIRAARNGSSYNGYTISTTRTGSFAVSTTAFSGGVDDTFQPGTFVKTVGEKMYSTAGPVTHFSVISDPTKWTTDSGVGAGFIDMSMQSSGAEKLVALARYQDRVAVFAERVIQIWFFDPNPENNRFAQTLNNTGTISPLSVTQFGDADIFYLDESGLRSLRARDSSNAAATTDVGVPVDTLIVEKLRKMSDAQRSNIIGLIEPRDGRFWLIAGDIIYVFSYFSGAKVSAWSTYVPSDTDGNLFTVDAAVVHNKRVYVRGADKIYVYGGLGDEIEYDGTVAEAWLPYLDADNPTRKKFWRSIDAALMGEWEIRISTDPEKETVTDIVARPWATTYEGDLIPFNAFSTHISVRFKTRGAGPARLSSVAINFRPSDGDDN